MSAALLVTSAGVGLASFMRPATAALAPGTICHATAANPHPYQNNPPSYTAQAGGHAAHNGPVWYHDGPAGWGDIIPPFDYVDGDGNVQTFPGLNWGTSGQEIWANDCGAVYPDLSIVKTSTTGAAEGGSGTYLLNVSNAGNGTAFATAGAPLVVRDTMPAGVIATAVSGTGWGCAVAGGGTSITCERTTDLAPGAVAGEIEVLVTWSTTGSKTNTATVDAARGEKVLNNNTSSVTTTVTGAVLSGTVVKASDADGNGTWTADETTATSNEAVTFRATVTNTSGVTVSLGALSDNYGAAPGTTITPVCADPKPATLAHNASFTCEFTVSGYTAAAGGSVNNTFSAVLSRTGSSSVAPTGSAVVRTGPVLSGTVVKVSDADGNGTWTADETTATSNEAVTFRATVTNTSGVAVSLGALSDNYGAAPGTTITPTCLAAKPATLAAGDSYTCEFTVSAYTAAAGGSVSDTFSATLSRSGSNSVTPTGQAVVRTSAPDLKLTKSAPATRTTGQTGDYTLLVENVGTAAATDQITVTDTLPSGVTATGPVSSGGFACTVAMNVVTCVSDDDLAVNGSKTITLPATFTTVGNKTNSATVSLAGDSNTANNTSVANTSVTDSQGPPPPIVPPLPADLAVQKTGPARVAPGDTATWTLTVTNKGPGNASGFSVTDTLPVGVSITSLSGSNFACTAATGVCTFSSVLLPGSTAVVTLVGDVSPTIGDSSLANVVVVGPPDATPADNTDTLVSVIERPAAPADLVLEKSAPEAPSVPGGDVVWTITVTNAGGSAATGFSVVDEMGEGLTLSSVETDGFDCAQGPMVDCAYTGSLAAGDSVTLVVTTALADEWASSSVANTAHAVLADDPTPENNTDTATGGVALPIDGGTVDPGSGPPPVQEPKAPRVEPNPVPGRPAEPAAEQPRALPFTGSVTDQLLGLGVGLAVIGLMLALAGRRRRAGE